MLMKQWLVDKYDIKNRFVFPNHEDCWLISRYINVDLWAVNFSGHCFSAVIP